MNKGKAWNKKFYNAGDNIGSFTFIRDVEPIIGNRMGVLRCFCGKEITLTIWDAKSGKRKSCGCIPKRKTITHGLTKSRIYTIWFNIKQRCINSNNPNFERYGGRGIDMDPSWINSFEVFLYDMGLPPSEKHSIDRIDNSKGYFKHNCRWVTIYT